MARAYASPAAAQGFGVGGLLPLRGFVTGDTCGSDFAAHDSALLRRIAGTVAIMLYEMELHPDGSFECLTFVGLDTFIGPVPDGVSPEDAYDAAVHPEDREVYDAAMGGDELWQGEPVEMEYRLLDPDGGVRWVLDRMKPERQLDSGSLLISEIVVDISKRKRVEV